VIVEGGLINCKWTRIAKTTVKDILFDLSKNYYILLAKGTLRIKSQVILKSKYNLITKVTYIILFHIFSILLL